MFLLSLVTSAKEVVVLLVFTGLFIHLLTEEKLKKLETDFNEFFWLEFSKDPGSILQNEFYRKICT